MDTRGQVVRKNPVDHAMTVDPALAGKRLRYDIDAKVGLPAGPMPCMALMHVRFIDDIDTFRCESIFQLLRDGIPDKHGALPDASAGDSRFVSIVNEKIG